jgi:hypothetical protein
MKLSSLLTLLKSKNRHETGLALLRFVLVRLWTLVDSRFTFKALWLVARRSSYDGAQKRSEKRLCLLYFCAIVVSPQRTICTDIRSPDNTVTAESVAMNLDFSEVPIIEEMAPGHW